MRRDAVIWVEVVCLLPCSLILGIFLLLGVVWMLLLLAASLFGSAQPAAPWWKGLGGTALFLFLWLSCLAGLAAMWACVLLGPERLRQRTLLRCSALACLILGLGPIGYLLAYLTFLEPGATSGPWGLAFWTLPLAPAIVLSLRYAYLLLRPMRTSQNPA